MMAVSTFVVNQEMNWFSNVDVASTLNKWKLDFLIYSRQLILLGHYLNCSVHCRQFFLNKVVEALLGG